MLPEQSENQKIEVMKGRQFISPALAGILLIALYCPVLLWLVGVWLNNPYYSHGFLVLPISGFIAWTKREQLVKATPSIMGIIFLVIGLTTYVLGFVLGINWLWAFSILVVTSGLFYYLGGLNTVRTLLFPICFLVFMIPLPFIDSLAVLMQTVSASLSAIIAQAAGIPIIRTGAEIALPDVALIIGVACSGMNTLYSLLALTALLQYLLEASHYKKVILFLLVFPVAIVANSLRIVILIMVAHLWGGEATVGLLHNFSSLFIFSIAFVLLILFSRILGCQFRGIEHV